MKKIGVVIQRFGEEVVGGSEFYALKLLKKLNKKYKFTVYTTTAKNYITWNNEYDEGISFIDGIEVKRYKVLKKRDIKKFNEYSDKFFKKNNKTKEDEENWIIRQGPYCPDLIQAVKNEQKKYDFFFLFTYLYYPIYFSIPLINVPKILFPTTHDEAPLYMKVMNQTFDTPDIILALTEKELSLINKVFPKPKNQIRDIIGGIGIEPDRVIEEKEFLKKYTPIIPFVFYMGRIDEGKGCNFLIENFLKFSKRNYIQLLLAGKKNMKIISDFRIKYVGFLSEKEKWQALKAAALYIHPSMFESLSISMLEAMSVGTPVLVNGRSPVMKEHIRKSNAGLYYMDEESFTETLDTIIYNKSLSRNLGINGINYVKKYYSWDKILKKIQKIISGF